MTLNISVVTATENAEFRNKEYDGVEHYDLNIDERKLQVLGLTLSRSLPGDEKKTIGNSPMKESGGQGVDDNGQVCFEGDNSVLLLNYKFQFDPTIRYLHKIVLTTDKKAKEIFAPCTHNPKITNDLKITGGIQLGMTPVELKKIWGNPSKVAPGIVIYLLRRNTNDYFTDDIGIYSEFKNDKLTYVEVLRRSIH